MSITSKTSSIEAISRPSAGDEFTTFTAVKKWVGGEDRDHTAPVLILYADGVKTDIGSKIEPTSGTSETFNYTWENLKKHNASGAVIEYTVKEFVERENDVVVKNGNEYRVSQDGNVITNTYVPKVGSITVNKVWLTSDKALKLEKPKVNLMLYRKMPEQMKKRSEMLRL